MNKLVKIIVGSFVSLALTATAFAGEVTVTGSAKASYLIKSSGSSTGKTDARKSWGVSNELSFAAAGELDNGYTWNWGVDFDQADDTITGGGIDDAKLTLTTPYGTFGIFQSEGSLRSAAYGWDTSAFGAATDNGASGSMVIGYEVSSLNNIQYHLPADLLPFGITGQVAYASSCDAGPNDFKGAGAACTPAVGTTQTVTAATTGLSAETTGAVYESVTQYAVQAAPIDGLTVKLDYTDFSHKASANNAEEGHAAVKYATGPVTIGYGKGWISPENNSVAATGVESFENTSYGVGFKVNDQLSVSYTEEKSDVNLNTHANEVTLKVTSIQAAYNIGGATFAVSQSDIENDNYTTNKDNKATLFTLVMAF
jgi:hypothetical protein